MGQTRTDEFRKDAVRIALTSGLTRKQIASDLGVGMSTLNKWITAPRHSPSTTPPRGSSMPPTDIARMRTSICATGWSWAT